MRLLWAKPHGSDVERAILEFDQCQALQRWLADAQVTGSFSKPPMLLIKSVLRSYEFCAWHISVDEVMGDHVNSAAERILGWTTFAVMTAAAAGLLFQHLVVPGTLRRGVGRNVHLQFTEVAMLYWTLIFLIVAIVAAFLGFGGMAIAAAGIAKILFFIFLVLFLVSLLTNVFRRA
jgi:uncharacterized membrane protein YtjA (UPF0391 family)